MGRFGSLLDGLDGVAGLYQEMGEAVVFVGIDSVDQMVRNGAAVFDRGLGGANIHVAVDLPAVGADDLARVPNGQPEGQLTLANGGGTDDGQETGFHRGGQGRSGSRPFRHLHYLDKGTGVEARAADERTIDIAALHHVVGDIGGVDAAAV